jgi:hypothetical protein
LIQKRAAPEEQGAYRKAQGALTLQKLPSEVANRRLHGPRKTEIQIPKQKIESRKQKSAKSKSGNAETLKR